MLNIILSGCNGKMGQVISNLVAESYPQCRIVAGIDINTQPLAQGVVVYPSPYDIPKDKLAQIKVSGETVMIDFSHPNAAKTLLDFAIENNIPTVIATTGIQSAVIEYMKETASASVPVFFSANMSIGICLLKDLAKRAAAFLGEGFDIEIVERHHNRKIDAPSGTALALADAINSANTDKFKYVYDRHSRSAPRSKNEIGISAVRGGNIVGDHEVIYAGNNEIIEISHHALSRNIFADGAVRAALFLADKEPGFYNMDDLIK